ncbi:CHAT domain-containing tetratricopeptide repeat protein [Baaleninema sp.]|uniref:CHAT domain-containing tetratricopeptide repeat protein n=1 Tax=Baaleninema sp. TaxID=3101197 RepID=UPI003D038A2E
MKLSRNVAVQLRRTDGDCREMAKLSSIPIFQNHARDVCRGERRSPEFSRGSVAGFSKKGWAGAIIAVSIALSGGIAGNLNAAVAQPREDSETQVQESRQAEADRLFEEGFALSEQATMESRQAAIAIWERSLELYRQLRQPENEAKTLRYMGQAYYALGELQQALEYYQQALPIHRQVGDREGEMAILLGIGEVYHLSGQVQQALEYYQQALMLAREASDRSQEASSLNNIGTAYQFLGQPRLALDYLDRALSIHQELGDREEEAKTLSNIGFVYTNLGDRQQALEYFDRALSLARTVGDRDVEATLLNNLGGIYQGWGQLQPALEYYEQALALDRETGNRNREAITLNNIGSLYENLGQRLQALEYFQQALPIFRELGNQRIEAVTLNNIGTIFQSIGEVNSALNYYEKALSVHQELQNQDAEAATLNNIGFAYESLGKPQQALEYFNRALLILRDVGNVNGEASVLNNIGSIYDNLGQRQEALNAYERALVIFRQVGDRAGEASTLNNIGRVYKTLGQLQLALDYYNQTLSMEREVGDRAGVATTLNNIGTVYDNLGEFQTALEYYEQSLPMLREVGDRTGEANTLANMGGVYKELEQFQKALEYYEQALSIYQEVENRTGLAGVLNNIGLAYNLLGQPQQARNYYERALSIEREIGNRDGEATTLNNLAWTYRTSGNLEAALTHIEAAIDLLENLRLELSSSELRTSYFATVQDYYSFYIDLLMELHQQQPNSGYDARAFHASERTRTRSLLELLAEANIDMRRGIPPELTQRETQLRQQLNAAAIRQQELWNSGEPDDAAVEEIRNQISQLEIQLQQVEAEIRQASLEAAALKYPEPLTLEAVQRQVVDDETVLLQYSLGENRSFVWVVTPDSISSIELPPRDEITTLANDLRRVLSDPYAGSRDLKNVARPLSDAILAPVADRLGDQRLLIVADGILQTLPFAVLAIPGEEEYAPLLVDYEIVNSPSSSLIGTVREFHRNRSQPSQTLAVVADPVFGGEDDTRATVRGEDDPLRSSCYDTTPRRLPGTAAEAETVAALLPSSETLMAVEFDAQRQLVLSDALSNYRIVHLATHGCFDETNPRLSALALSLVDEAGNPVDGYLRLHDIYNLNLPADLVVLSACQTAVGDNIRGEGVVGLTRGFFQAGTSRLIASLWSVSDASTARLMEQFYQNYLEEGMTPSEALREVQLRMWRGEENPQWRNPYYWAAFVFQGEWR